MIEIAQARCRREYPPDWDLVPLGSVVEVNAESLGHDTPAHFQFQYIDISAVDSKGIDWSLVRDLRYAASPSRARRVVRPQDVLFCTVRPALQAHAYAAWNSNTASRICSTGFAVLRSRRVHPRYLYYLIFGEDVTAQVRALEVGSNYPAVNESDVARLTIPVPPADEQRRIAEILDTADEAIRGTEALIGKLRAMKAGLLDDLLTRGLDQHGHLRDPATHPEQFKDSPLGRIPDLWGIEPLEKLVEPDSPITYGVVKPGPEDSNGVLFVRGGDFPDGEIEIENLRTITPQVSSQYERTLLRGGELLVSLVGQPGACAVVPRELAGANIARQAALVRLRPDVHPHFVRAYIASPQGHRMLMGDTLGSVQQVINLNRLRKVLVPLPKAAEQDAIVERASIHDARIRAEEAYLDKLKLQKKGLMHDLLTGRVRVKIHEEVGA